jgi:hypothetical protein
MTGAQIAAAFVTVFEGGLRPRGNSAQGSNQVSNRERTRLRMRSALAR